MSKNLLIVAFALTLSYGTMALAESEYRGYEGLQYTLVNEYEHGIDGARPVIWLGGFGQPENVSVNSEEKLIKAPLVDDGNIQELTIGSGATPLFEEYGVIRASGNLPKSTYLALGFTVDEVTMDEADLYNSWDAIGLSYGIGISSSSYDVEYMLSVDEESRGVSAIGLGITSRF